MYHQGYHTNRNNHYPLNLQPSIERTLIILAMLFCVCLDICKLLYSAYRCVFTDQSPQHDFLLVNLGW